MKGTPKNEGRKVNYRWYQIMLYNPASLSLLFIVSSTKSTKNTTDIVDLSLNQLEKLEAAKAACLVYLSLLSLTGSFLALLGLT